MNRLTLYRVSRTVVLVGVLVCGLVGHAPRVAADSMSVTVIPPLFQLTIGPGESWASVLKIVNNNSYDVTYYNQVMDMQASGEDGRSKFIPVVDESGDPAEKAIALGSWVHLASDSVLIKAGTSQDIPFTVDVPKDAEPGGHYAAILVGTQPGGIHATGTVLKVSSFVSSLLFVRIKGDVAESGRIREFLTSQSLYQTPKVDFTLRFENTGNTHVRPQGDITIYNMWGKERGRVLINQDPDGNFGNVLPKSLRRFEFSWEGTSDLFDIGLYSATVALSFGDEGKQNATSKTYFWVIPIIPVAIVLGSFLFFLFSIVWFIRRYIRRALELEQRRYGISQTPTASNPSPKPTPAPSIVEALMEPVREGVIDLRSATRAKLTSAAPTPVVTTKALQYEQQPHSIGQLARKYRLFLLFLLVLIVGGIGVWIYFTKVLEGKRGFQITDVRIHAENAPKP